MTPFQLIIRFIGYGKRCSHCGHLEYTTQYSICQKKPEPTILQSFYLCDTCQDKGFTVNFSPSTSHPKQSKAERKRRIKISRKLEQEVAIDTGGKIQPGSGNQDEKGDIRKIGEWRIEHKYTDSLKAFRLTTDILDTIIKHANMADEWPAVVINFRKLKRKFTVLPYELFISILENLHD